MVTKPGAIAVRKRSVLTASPAAMAALRHSSIRSQNESNLFWYINRAKAPSSRKLFTINRWRVSHSMEPKAGLPRTTMRTK